MKMNCSSFVFPHQAASTASGTLLARLRYFPMRCRRKLCDAAAGTSAAWEIDGSVASGGDLWWT